eukprot:CAMPEP_0181395762 /NCGR_PEP_ID=MMETSP1106-20121128/28517_1 /TAXON_ID=81844 /ORGANISM="Mantoniella antarctica, Strain SL-175" /LENGTH=69 /DNA_ID=CAMNT_0023517413 /DNA_START=176 /DNA_END=381 /DNA_ORIENTATION=+
MSLAVMRNVARKLPPTPEPFLISFDCVRWLTAGDDDAPADCHAREPKTPPELWSQKFPARTTVCVEGQR